MRKPLCKMPGSRIELYPKSVDLQRPELIVGGAEQALVSLAVVGIERVELVGGAVLLQGLLAVAFALQGVAEKVMGARVVWVEAERLAVFGDLPIRVALFSECVAEVSVRKNAIRIQAQRFALFSDIRLPIALFSQCCAEVDVCI